jgi:hypothetical protein
MVIIKLIPWRFMMAQKIQRVDTIPLIIGMLKKMGVEKSLTVFLLSMAIGPDSVRDQSPHFLISLII